MNQAKHAVNIIRVGDELIHYHARHNFSFLASQLVCLPAYQTACLITCPHTEHLLSRLKGHRWGRGDILFIFTRIHFEKEMCWVPLPCVPKISLPPSLVNHPASSYYSLWQVGFLSTCLLKFPVTSVSLCFPPFPVTPGYLPALPVFNITVCCLLIPSLPKWQIKHVERKKLEDRYHSHFSMAVVKNSQ